MIALSEYEVYILLCWRRGALLLFLFSALGLNLATKSIRRLENDDVGSILISNTGDVLEICGFRNKNDRPISNALRAFFGLPREIVVDLKRCKIDFSELKRLVISGLEEEFNNPTSDEEEWAIMGKPFSEIQMEIEAAKSAVEVYDLLRLPRPEDCLDLL